MKKLLFISMTLSIVLSNIPVSYTEIEIPQKNIVQDKIKLFEKNTQKNNKITQDKTNKQMRTHEQHKKNLLPNQTTAPQHRIVFDQANKTAQYFLKKIKVLHEKIDQLLIDYPNEPFYVWAKDHLNSFEGYFETEGLRWMATLIEDIYLGAQQSNMQLQLKYLKNIKEFTKDCNEYLRHIEEVIE